MDFKNLKNKICEPRVSRLLQNVCDFQEENHALDMDFFFVISISGRPAEDLSVSHFTSLLCAREVLLDSP